MVIDSWNRAHAKSPCEVKTIADVADGSVEYLELLGITEPLSETVDDLGGTTKFGRPADMVSLGRPGEGESFLDACGFDVAERFEIPFVFEFPDPATFAAGIGSTGPAYEAIQSIGEEEFINRATELAAEHVRDGLALRGEIQLFGYIGTKR